jgi:hypothetical protein
LKLAEAALAYRQGPRCRCVAAARRASLEFDHALALVERGDDAVVTDAAATFDRLGVEHARITPLCHVVDKVTSLAGG